MKGQAANVMAQVDAAQKQDHSARQISQTAVQAHPLRNMMARIPTHAATLANAGMALPARSQPTLQENFSVNQGTGMNAEHSRILQRLTKSTVHFRVHIIATVKEIYGHPGLVQVIHVRTAHAISATDLAPA